jgi:hypothetical protein
MPIGRCLLHADYQPNLSVDQQHREHGGSPNSQDRRKRTTQNQWKSARRNQAPPHNTLKIVGYFWNWQEWRDFVIPQRSMT